MILDSNSNIFYKNDDELLPLSVPHNYLNDKRDETNNIIKISGSNGTYYALDKYGYLPCSCAIMISRLFGLTHLYKRDFPIKLWGLEELCQHCIFSMDPAWRAQHSCKRLSEHTIEEKTPTKSYQEALDKWKPEEFYKTQPEF